MNEGDHNERSWDEAGNIGDEQNPAYIQKTDKQEWDHASSKAKRKSLIDRLQQLEEGESPRS